MAYPGALILRFADGIIASAQWHDLPHVALMRDFLNHLESFLQHIQLTEPPLIAGTKCTSLPGSST